MTRLLNAWGQLGRDQRIAALTSLGLFISMLLPWYSKTDTVVVRDAARATQQSLSAFQAFSFVEAAVLLVSAGVLTMLFARAEQRDFHLPGGDGTIVMIAGAWTAILIFYRLLDKPGLQGNERVTSAVGVQWGIFVALLLALGLAYVGRRIRLNEHAAPPAREPRRPRPRDPDPVRFTQPAQAPPPVQPARERPDVAATEPIAPRSRSRFPPAPSEQMSFEDQPTDPLPGEE